MKRKFLIIASTIIVLFVSLKLYRKWQYDSLGYQQPRLETLASLGRFANDSVLGTVLVAKDTNTIELFENIGSISGCMLLDSNYKIISDNISNHNGNCYADIVAAICNDFNFSSLKKGNFESFGDGKKWVDSLLHNSILLGDSINTQKRYDYIFIYGWARYVKESYAGHPLILQQYLSTKEDKKMLVLALNNDYVDVWYGNSEEIPKLQPFKWF